MGEERPNFYILLELDPYAEWDANRFVRVLKAKQDQWSNASMGIGPQSLVAQRNRSLIPTIRQVMNDPQKRTEEGQKAKMLRAQQREKRLVEFEHATQGKRLDADQIEQLILDFADVLSADEIYQKLPVQNSQLGPQPGIELSSGPIIEDFEQNLGLLGLSNLYEMLHLPRTATSARLVQAAEELFEEMRRRQPQTATVIAYGELAGYARTIFSQSESRRGYDEHLDQKQREAAASTHPDSGALPNIPPQYASPQPPMSGTQYAVPQPPISGPLETSVQISQASLSSALFTPIQQAPADIENLELRNLDGGLRLTWQWPADCIEALVSYSHSDWPQPGTQNTQQIVITRMEYQHRNGGHCDLYGPPNQPCYVHVQAVMRSGQRKLTAGQRKQETIRPTIGVRYEIKNPRLGRRERLLCLYAEPTAPVSIPVTLVLMIKRGSVPMFKEDGREFYRIEGSAYEPIEIETAKGKIIPLPSDQLINFFGKLFVEDEQWASSINLHLPSREKLRFN